MEVNGVVFHAYSTKQIHQQRIFPKSVPPLLALTLIHRRQCEQFYSGNSEEFNSTPGLYNKTELSLTAGEMNLLCSLALWQ